jgi:hypothetical protein
MYKNAFENQQRRADFIKLADLAGGTETQTPEERRRNLVARIKQLDAEIQACDDRTEKKRLGKLKCDLQEEARAIRPKYNGHRDVANFIVDAMRERLPAPQVKIIINAGVKAYEEYMASHSEVIEAESKSAIVSQKHSQ